MPDFDFGDIAQSADYGSYFGQGAGSAMPSFTPETSWTAPAADAAKSGGGFMSDFAGAAKSALPWLQLGTTGMGMASGIQAASAAGEQAKTASRAQKVGAESARQAQAAAQPAAEFGAMQLKQAGAGQLDPSIEAGITQWKQAMIQRVQDYAARTGQGDSTWLQSKLEEIEQHAVAMRAEMLQKEQGLGLDAIRTAEGGFQTSAGAAGATQQAASSEVGALDALIASANKQMAQLGASA